MKLTKIGIPESRAFHNGELVRFKTKTHKATVFRQKFKQRDGSWQHNRGFYYKRMVGGVSVCFPLGLDAKQAEATAEEIAAFLSLPQHTLEQAIARYNPRAAARANQIATVGDVMDTYKKALAIIGRNGKAVSESTYKGYRSFMLTMLRRVEAYRAGKEFESFMGQSKVDFSPWLNIGTDHLTRKFAMDFKLASLPPEGDDADEEEILTAKITADTTLRNARAFFGKQAMRYYQEVKLNVADISGFMEEPDFGAKKYFMLLPPDVIVKVMRDSLELRLADVDAYRVFLLCVQCGLRAGEALAFKPSWLRNENRPVLYITAKGAFNPKHGHGRKAYIADWVANDIKRLGAVEAPESIDRLNTWLKARYGENDVKKPLHELRKLWMSYKAQTEGVLAAAQQGGHKDVKVTSTHYADSGMPDWLQPLWKQPTKDALAMPQFKAA